MKEKGTIQESKSRKQKNTSPAGTGSRPADSQDRKWMIPEVKRLLSGKDGQTVQRVLEAGKVNEGRPAKNLCALWILKGQGQAGKKQASGVSLKTLRHSARFREFAALQLQEAKARFQISGMVSVMSAVLLIYFLTSVLRAAYVISFSADALIASAALVILAVNLKSMLGAASLTGCRKECVVMDLCAGGLCILAKSLLPAAFDASLFILIAVYFLERSRFDKSAKTVSQLFAQQS